MVVDRDSVDILNTYKDQLDTQKEETKTQKTYENKLTEGKSIKRVFFEDVTDRMKTRSKTTATRAVNEGPEVIDVGDIDVPRCWRRGTEKHRSSQSKTSE